MKKKMTVELYAAMFGTGIAFLIGTSLGVWCGAVITQNSEAIKREVGRVAEATDDGIVPGLNAICFRVPDEADPRAER